jgi:hypothetical protein
MRRVRLSCMYKRAAEEDTAMSCGDSKALFLTHSNLLRPGGGGNEICTREYHDVLTAAGFDLLAVTYSTERSLKRRLRNKLSPSSYPDLIPADYWSLVLREARGASPVVIFCNFCSFLPHAATLRRIADEVGARVVLLSHGLESVDDVHRMRIAHTAYGRGQFRLVSTAHLSREMQQEARGLPLFDHVFCLAEFEVGICRWLGARSVSWWPRTFPVGPQVAWKPTGGRIGIIGTLDHPPNLEGAHLFCQAAAKLPHIPFRLRLVTRSEKVASDLAARYSFVDFVGSLDDELALHDEVGTWSTFLHPIFCYAMGCSTKIAVGLSWGLPVLTTPAGLRGYRFSEALPPTALSPVDMAEKAAISVSVDAASMLREQSLGILAAAPTVREVGAEMAAHLSA